jgi:hypothetical protein
MLESDMPDTAVPRAIGVCAHPFRRAVRLVAMVAVAAAPLSVTGCAGSADASEQADADAAIERARSGGAGNVVALSDYEDATATSLVVDRSGATHAVWVDRPPAPGGPRLLYRGSRNGGGSWSSIQDLSSGQPDGFTGTPRLVADGAGRVYAIWKVINPGGTLVFDEEKPNAPAFGTLVYRVLEQGRWGTVQALGNPRGVLAWYAVDDTRGRVHVVWSENPGEFSAFTTPSNAQVVRHASLDGARPTSGRDLFRGAGNGGYWGLSGYVTAQGSPRWVAIRGDDGAGTYTVVHWNGSEERALLDFAPLLRGYDQQTLPRLVADGAGREHLIVYNGMRDQPGILDLVPGQRDGRTIVYQPRNRGSSTVRDFQISRGPSGQLVATVQVAGEGVPGLTDLFASEFDGRAWSTPVRLTNNAARGTEVGVVDVNGRSLGNAKAWQAVHASVAYDPSGAPVLLMTNRETSASLDVRPGGSVSQMGRSKAFFTRPPGLTSASVASGGQPATGGSSAATPSTTGDAPRTRPAPPRTTTANASSPEQRFARYDITESGTLSGTELDACNCRHHDANDDGRVSRAEFIAGSVLDEAGLPALGTRQPTPAATPPASPTRRAAPDPTPRADAGAPLGKYNCYAAGARQPMPWEPGYGNVAEAPIATTKYIMNLTIAGEGNYQYLDRGRGTYRLDDTGMIAWLSGPFAGSGIKAALGRRADGRPVIHLDLEGTRANCVGPER